MIICMVAIGASLLNSFNTSIGTTIVVLICAPLVGFAFAKMTFNSKGAPFGIAAARLTTFAPLVALLLVMPHSLVGDIWRAP